MKPNFLLSSVILLVFCLTTIYGNAQTLFETAEGEGVIQFRRKTLSQIKLNLASTSITYGYYYVRGTAASKGPRFLFSGEIKAKPNSDGIATLVKSGQLAPGLQLNSSFGLRLKSITDAFFSPLDIYLKPQVGLNGYTIYDTTRRARNEEVKYKTTQWTSGLLAGLNTVLSPGSVNFFIGAEIGIQRGANADDMDKGILQTAEPVAGSTTAVLLRDAEEVRIGVLERQTAHPLKADLIFDPGLSFSKGSSVRPATFGYYRRDLSEQKHRYGVGICLVDDKDPSKIFTSFGYEFPVTGDGVDADDRKKDKGIVFVSIGYSIF